MLASFCRYCAPLIVLFAAINIFSFALPLAVAEEPSETITNSIGLKLKLIPSGEFIMGGESFDEFVKTHGNREDFHPQMFDDEQPKHRVKITKAFYLGVYEVTKEQFSQFVEAEKYRTDAEKDPKGGLGWNRTTKSLVQKPEFSWREWGLRDWGADDSPSAPAVNLSWNDAVSFCKWLSQKEGKVYRLPTEAEWEYACRAGTSTRHYNGDDPKDVFAIGNVDDGWAFWTLGSREMTYSAWKTEYKEAKSRDGYAFTAPVGRFKPNRFGLYDMVGNAKEWCADWYAADYYARSPADDPKGPEQGSVHVLRSEGWYHSEALFSYSGHRTKYQPQAQYECTIGFRVVREK
jgi:sulfatase modifying factor 1